MATLKQRLTRLEKKLLGTEQCRQVIGIVVDRHSQAEIDDFLRTEGIQMSDNVWLIITSIVTPDARQAGPQSPIRRLY